MVPAEAIKRHVGASDQTLRAWVADHVAAPSAIPDVKAFKYLTARHKNAVRLKLQVERQIAAPMRSCRLSRRWVALQEQDRDVPQWHDI